MGMKYHVRRKDSQLPPFCVTYKLVVGLSPSNYLASCTMHAPSSGIKLKLIGKDFCSGYIISRLSFPIVRMH